MIVQGGFRGDTYVIYVNPNCGSLRLVFEDGVTIDEVHHRLKGCWRVAQAEKHYRWFKEPIFGFERRLFFVTLTNSDVVIPTANIDFCVVEGPPQVVDVFRSSWYRSHISDSDVIEFSVILDGA